MKRIGMKSVVVFFVGMLLSVSLSAYDSTSRSLVGIETGYGQFDYSASNDDNINMGRTSSSEDFGILGLKIGAQTDEFRLFIDAHYYQVGGAFDYANSYGLSFQYLIAITKDLNFFIGLNGGLMNLKVVDSAIGKSYEYSDPYFGGDVGFNYDIYNTLALEVGLRYININADNKQYYKDTDTGDTLSRTYKVEQMINIYTSLIFKFYMD
jgi:hypothetical protein